MIRSRLSPQTIISKQRLVQDEFLYRLVVDPLHMKSMPTPPRKCFDFISKMRPEMFGVFIFKKQIRILDTLRMHFNIVVRGVRARSARISLFLFTYCTQSTHSYHLHNSYSYHCHFLVFLAIMPLECYEN